MHQAVAPEASFDEMQPDEDKERALRLEMDARMSAVPRDAAYAPLNPPPRTTGFLQQVKPASATHLLDEARGCLMQRAVNYDAPEGERSMSKTVAAFNAIHGLGMTEVQGWQFMELLKIVRSSQGEPKSDNFIDGAAYAALAGEAAMNGAK